MGASDAHLESMFHNINVDQSELNSRVDKDVRELLLIGTWRQMRQAPHLMNYAALRGRQPITCHTLDTLQP
uniref:SFRICE_033576 n=1 Tax=Spodoptera frugiperda TaxID=7108 RepID=A0A2H1VRE6_SPOFR